MSKVQISYIGVCYAMLALLFACVILACCLSSTRLLLAITLLSAFCISLTAIALAFIRHKRWAWFASWFVGVFAVLLGAWMIWASVRGAQYGDSGAGGIMGILILAFALPALWNMATSEVEKFVLKEEA